jgi:hypothetical protein
LETIDLTDGFDLKRIAQSWDNLSVEHSVDRGSTLLFGDRFGIQLPVLERAPTEIVHRWLDLTDY